MKKTLLTASLLLSFFTQATDVNKANLAAHENFRTADEIVENQAEWFRELKYEKWMKGGITEAEIDAVLMRIKSGGEFRDVPNLNKAGSWTYEFSQFADEVLLNANNYEEYRKASYLYTIASFPNHLTDQEHDAVKRSAAAYIKAESFNKNLSVELVDMPLPNGDGSIKGLMHIPVGLETPPVILLTGGVDVTMTEHRAKLDRYFDNGYAVLTFDIPAGGLNNKIYIELGKEDQAHQAAYRYVKSDTRVDGNNVGALTSSGGGVPLITFTMNTPELKAVVARCAVVDEILANPEFIKKAPLMSSMSLGYRIGVKDATNLDSYGKYSIPLALRTKGITAGITDVPIFAINTADDMVASPAEMQYTASLSTNGKIGYFGEEGHCPKGKEAAMAILQFFNDNMK